MVLSLSALSSPSSSSSSSGDSEIDRSGELVSRLSAKSSKLLCRLSGLGAVGRLPLRILDSDRMLWRSEMTCPAFGAAVTTVFGVTTGGGIGESDRNSGWMCDSATAERKLTPDRWGLAVRTVGAGL
jgi:hypothetical protein